MKAIIVYDKHVYHQLQSSVLGWSIKQQLHETCDIFLKDIQVSDHLLGQVTDQIVLIKIIVMGTFYLKMFLFEMNPKAYIL